MLAWGAITTTSAQDTSSRSILKLGDAVVTGFSGVRPTAAPLPAGADPSDKTFIELAGPSARVINLDALGGPPQAQVVAALKPFSVTAAQVGQVFAIALDDAQPPNIYLAATSAYGLPIVVPDRDGDGRPDRARRGGPYANFMPGLFGPVTANGGPGSIWKVDGRTGAVALFANVTLDRIANSGPALGGLAFDPATRQLFVADRDTGMIHRFGLDGTDRGRFDHGADALPALGLPSVRFDPRKRLDLSSPDFDSGNPARWAYAPQPRRVFGLAVRDGRLYYAVAAGLQIWSVSVAQNGAFGSDPRLELNVPRGKSAAEISKIVFDGDGRMIVAERGAPTGAYDFNALAEAGENRVLRFRLKHPGDPPGPGLWYPVAEEYPIGFPLDFRNGNGGIAIGYGPDAGGNINRAACRGTLWSTGEQLRNASARPIAQRLQSGGPFIVNGLQGNLVPPVRPQNSPPLEAYYVDYDDRFDDTAARGHLGDVEIWQVCQAVAFACPAGAINVRGACVFPLACPLGTEFTNGRCVYPGCPASYVRIGSQCVPPPVNCKPNETYWGQTNRCEPPKCGSGLVQLDEDGKESISSGLQPAKGSYCACPAGQAPNDQGKCVGCTAKEKLYGRCGEKPADQPGEAAKEDPTTPVSGECLWWERMLGKCDQKPVDQPATDTCRLPDYPLQDGTCCTRADRQAGRCGSQPPARTEYCPSYLAKVDSSCCDRGQVAHSCFTRASGTACPAGESPHEDGAIAVCCRENPAGSCKPEQTVVPRPKCPVTRGLFGGSLTCTRNADCPDRNTCDVGVCTNCNLSRIELCLYDANGDPGKIAVCLLPLAAPIASKCQGDYECPEGSKCNNDGACVAPSQAIPQPGCLWGYYDSPTGRRCCTPSDTEVAGRCKREPGTGVTIIPPPIGCSPEALAAGVCGAGSSTTTPPPSGVCPPNTTAMFGACCTQQQITSETCGMPPPAKPVATPTIRPQPTPCPAGFRRQGGNCVQDIQPQGVPGFSIGIGIGGGPSGRGPSGGSKPPPSSKPN